MRFILLRGLGRDQLHWTPLLNAMKKNFPGASIETPDLPGAGILFKENSPLKIQQYIPFLEKQLDANDEPATLIGLSLGGMIALKWAEKSPEKFNQLILINSSSRLNFFYQRLKVFNAIRYPGVIALNKKTKETATYKLTCNTRPVDEETIERWTKIQQQHPVKAINQLRQLIAALCYSLPPENQLPPVHILYSKADRLVSPQCSRKLVQYYGATSDSHDWGGHDLSEDVPEWVAQKLAELLKAKIKTNVD
ncbi:alpha/beta fold hydrolase [Aliikangiella coralliicola]|uniref:Alpha/beta hydrolase n=1 Tax=Aliikangiella coralliicola TaxID=2592383 RepID=A0A545UCF1_9GAMM|nr:alpha/beta hydrolase [Aliikangiella coralliicola]TQV87151.1 alpha/beta hydrolase [Aliikangiella coralliicola]